MNDNFFYRLLIHPFLNQDYAEKDEEDELKVFYFIFFSVILVQKQNEQLLNEELIFRDFLRDLLF